LFSITVNKTYTEFISFIDDQMHRVLTPEADWEALVIEAKQASWFTSSAGQSSSLFYLSDPLIIISQIINFVPSNCHMLFSVHFFSSFDNK